MNVDMPLSPEARNILTSRQSFVVRKAEMPLDAERATGSILPREARDAFSAANEGRPVGRPPATPHLNFWGGQVLDKPTISNIFVGDYWNTAPGQGDLAHMSGFTKTFGQSKMFDMLSPQYGVGRTEHVGDTVIAGPLAKPNFNKDDIIATVKNAIASGAVQDGPQEMHVVHLPPGAILEDGAVNSLQGLGGYHGSYIDDKGKPVYYVAIANADAQNGIDFAGSRRDNNTVILSHELVESVTNPNIAQAAKYSDLGWYDYLGGEIGDLAVNDAAMPLTEAFARNEHGYTVQVEWDNKNGIFAIEPSRAKVISAAAQTAPSAALSAAETQSQVSLGKNVDIAKLLMDVNLNNPSGVVPQLTLSSPSGKSFAVKIPPVANYQGTLDLSLHAAGLPSKGTWFLSATDPSNSGVKLNSWGLNASGIPVGSAG